MGTKNLAEESNYTEFQFSKYWSHCMWSSVSVRKITWDPGSDWDKHKENGNWYKRYHFTHLKMQRLQLHQPSSYSIWLRDMIPQQGNLIEPIIMARLLEGKNDGTGISWGKNSECCLYLEFAGRQQHLSGSLDWFHPSHMAENLWDGEIYEL